MTGNGTKGQVSPQGEMWDISMDTTNTKNTTQTQPGARKVEQLTKVWVRLQPAEKATVYAMLKALRANTAGNTALAREWWEVVKLLSPDAAKAFEARVLP